MIVSETKSDPPPVTSSDRRYVPALEGGRTLED